MPQAPEILSLEALYHAINRFDVPAALALFDPAVVRVEFEGTPQEGAFRGLEELEAHFRDGGRNHWDEGGCFPEKFLPSGSKVVVLVRVKVRMKATGEWVEGRVADAYDFRGGKVTEWRSFAEEKDAFAWAGLPVV